MDKVTRWGGEKGGEQRPDDPDAGLQLWGGGKGRGSRTCPHLGVPISSIKQAHSTPAASAYTLSFSHSLTSQPTHAASRAVAILALDVSQVCHEALRAWSVQETGTQQTLESLCDPGEALVTKCSISACSSSLETDPGPTVFLGPSSALLRGCPHQKAVLAQLLPMGPKGDNTACPAVGGMQLLSPTRGNPQGTPLLIRRVLGGGHSLASPVSNTVEGAVSNNTAPGLSAQLCFLTPVSC